MKSVRTQLLELKSIISSNPDEALEYVNKWLNSLPQVIKKKEAVTSVYNDRLKDVWFELSKEKTNDK